MVNKNAEVFAFSKNIFKVKLKSDFDWFSSMNFSVILGPTSLPNNKNN